MDAQAARAFLAREWAAVETLKRRYWADRFRARGPEAGFRLGSALFEFARSVRADWPSERDRAEDLAHHVALKRQLDQAARGFGRR